MGVESRLTVGVVTVSEHKVRAVEHALPDHDVVWVSPSGPDEKVLSAPIPRTQDLSLHISNAKATHWATFLNPLEIFNDVTRIAQNWVFERPQDKIELIDQIMSQSGQQVIIRAAFTATYGGRTSSVTVDSILRTRPFTLREVEEKMIRDGDRAMSVSGGLLVEWNDLFDRAKPIQRQFTDHHTGRIIGLPNIAWESLQHATNRALITGAYPQPLQHLVNIIQ